MRPGVDEEPVVEQFEVPSFGDVLFQQGRILPSRLVDNHAVGIGQAEVKPLAGQVFDAQINPREMKLLEDGVLFEFEKGYLEQFLCKGRGVVYEEIELFLLDALFAAEGAIMPLRDKLGVAGTAGPGLGAPWPLNEFPLIRLL